MAVDEELAIRVRDALPGAAQKRMFGGLAFMVGGHLTVAVGTGDVMFRIGAPALPDALDLPGASSCVMGERTMKDWILVDTAALADDDHLTAWIDRATTFVALLPEK